MLGRGRIRRLEADLEQSRLQLVEARAENAKMRELIDKLWELVGVEAQRCNELLERLLSMKERGATGGQLPLRRPAPDPLPPDVASALAAVQEDGLEERARRWLDSGLSVEKVIDRILSGGEVPA